jgi:hypothetical protein
MPKKISVKKTLAPEAVSPVAATETLKKAPARKRAPKKAPVDQDVQQAGGLTLDYPQAGEEVISAEYTLRLTAPEGTPAVEVSIDDSEWRPCRFAVGHWWFDWSAYAAGKHTLRARASGPGGDWSVRRPVVVVL